MSFANGNEKTDHRPNLLVEKPVAPHDERVAMARLLHDEREDRPLRRSEFAVRVRRERNEVVLADEIRGGRLHRREVERTVAERPVRGEMRRQDVRLVELVAVFLPLRRQLGVERVLHPARPQDADVSRQLGVHRPHEILRRNRLRQKEVPDETLRVNTRIRPRRTVNPHGRPLDVCEGVLDDLLDSDGIRLKLPPGIRRPVVGDDDFVFALHFASRRVSRRSCRLSGRRRFFFAF